LSFVVLTDSTRVILPLKTRFETPSQLPVLKGLMISQAKASGHCLQSFIELGPPGLPRPFRGERWHFEWRSDGENLLACWLGFPNVFFSGGIDPNLRVAIEALGRFGTEKGALHSLSRISITVKVRETAPGPGDISWMPEDSPKTYPQF
jgi:hypothetical protein